MDARPLPATHIQLLRRMLSGSAKRGITIYDEPFWRSEGLSGMSVAPDLPVPVALDQSPRSGKPGILSSYMFGPQAVRAAALAPVERRHVWLQALAARYGSKALWPRAHTETDWAAEEWSLGGMIAHFAPGVLRITDAHCANQQGAFTGLLANTPRRCMASWKALCARAKGLHSKL
jgi:monoamine oxidase